MLHGPTQLQAVIEVSSNEGITWTPAPEYKPDIQAKACSAYIEAITGYRFRIVIRNHPNPSLRKEFTAYFNVDGHQAASRLLRRKKNGNDVQGFETSSTAFRPFAFGRIATTHDDAVATNTAKVKDLGEIVLKLWKVKSGKATIPAPERQAPVANVFAEQQVKKKSSHAVELRPQQTMRPVHARRSVRLESEPFLVFTFRYMSDVLLDLNDIKPLEIAEEVAPPPPQAAVIQPEASTSTASVKPKVKAEKIPKQEGKRTSPSGVIEIDDSEDEASELKRLREENARLRKKVKTEPKGKGQVIDLSED